MTDYKELYHYGVKGMKWGIRRYQNEDGTLTAKGEKRYYKQGSHGFDYHITKKGVRYNKQQKKKYQQYRDAVYANVKSVNKDFNKEVEKYKKHNKENNMFYLREREKYLKNQGEYKGLNKDEFKIIAAKKWYNTARGKAEQKSYNALKKMITEAANESPNSKKTYKSLEGYQNRLDNGPLEVRTYNYGKSAVDSILAEIQADSRKTHKTRLD